MKKQILSIFTVLLSVPYLYGQALNVEKETWAAKPALHTLDSKYSKEPAVMVYDKRRLEFIDDGKEVAEFYTLHKIVHIYDDRGIEEFNKIYLGANENSDITEIKARTILPNGKIVELDKSNIKDVKEDDGNVYKIFAMDGLEKGCELEYYYTYKRSGSYFGREIVQSTVPVVETTFQIISPDRLRFDIKPYNFTVSTSDTVLNSKRIAQCSIKDIPGAEEEKYATFSANLKRLEYKLSYNDETKKGERLFTWNELAKRVYGIYTFYTDKENRQVADIVAGNGWGKLADEPAKIIAVENYVKKRFSYNEELKSEDGNKLETVIHNKIGGTVGIMRLYNSIFQNLGINYQFVLTGDRNKFIIDREFENWNNCDYPIFYFPAEAKFMAPTRPDYRYPWIFPMWGGTNGLFCKRTSIGSFSTAIADVKPVALEDFSKSYNNIEQKMELGSSGDSLTMDTKLIYGGYVAVTFRDAFNFANEDQKRNIIKELAKTFSSSENIISTEILNKEFEAATVNQPLILHTKTRSGELIERAGNKLLIKIGLAIGPQVEMYQEKPRQETVSIDYGHIEERNIEFIIPQGYTISNLDDLKIDQTFKDDGELTMGFVSAYEVKGNVLTVHIREEYRKTFYPLTQFDQFRKIINASSDFNKVVLVLEKKS